MESSSVTVVGAVVQRVRSRHVNHFENKSFACGDKWMNSPLVVIDGEP